MSNLNNNTTQLEALLAKANALPDAGESSDPILQDKTITPTTNAQTITADSGYDGLDTVTVAAIPSTYVKPTSTKAATTYTPSISDQTIAAGTYCSGIQTIAGDMNLIAENIKNGVSIFGVVGTHSDGGSSGSNFGTCSVDVISMDVTFNIIGTVVSSDGTLTTQIVPSEGGRLQMSLLDNALCNSTFIIDVGSSSTIEIYEGDAEIIQIFDNFAIFKAPSTNGALTTINIV